MEQHHQAVTDLKNLGYPLINILRSLPTLTGITHAQISELIGTSRTNVAAHINNHRHNAIIQKKIARVWDIPPEELFENE